MRARLTVIAMFVALGSTAVAEPPKNAPVSPATPRKAPEVVLASAETAHAPAPESPQQSAAASTKRRVARVTTCRCGDPQLDPETQEQ
ncbi:MAG: hypothetical protein HOQ20_21680 [Bradyrhizobium sp.]|nr:hypothetical protein [Bradyrhizobium sp.]